MAHNAARRGSSFCCQSCGAGLEVRVGFKGKLVWAVDADTAAFGDTEPEMRGDSQDPQLVCTADVMHATGFELRDGSIAVDPKFHS